MIYDDNYLVRARQAGIPAKVIAAKLGMTVEQLEARWNDILQMVETQMSNGYLDLCNSVNVLATQYQLVGESLKIISQALGNVMAKDELKALIDPNPEVTLKNLRERAIILRPYIAITPQESLEKTLKGN